jgi:hypothetical protein
MEMPFSTKMEIVPRRTTKISSLPNGENGTKGLADTLRMPLILLRVAVICFSGKGLEKERDGVCLENG